MCPYLSYADHPSPPLLSTLHLECVQSAFGVTSSFLLRDVRTAPLCRPRYVNGFFSRRGLSSLYLGQMFSAFVGGKEGVYGNDSA